ncbi:MAG TPA: hypothetical protein VJ741_20960 [Solirubrobacteraceae bacterium]|nr:hypothetical protein [Solirubrobacteraceae bacterium]
MQRKPPALAQTVEGLTNQLLTGGAATPSIDELGRCAVDEHNAEDDDDLDRARRPAESQYQDRKD